MEEHHKDFKDFLMAEYDRYAALFTFSEETGEKRLTFFMSLVTAIVGGIVALFANSPKNAISNYPLIALLTVISITGLLSVGHIVYLRLVKRNITTDNCKDNMDDIRKRLSGTHTWTDDSISGYKRCGNKKAPDQRELGSLKDIVAIINMFLAAFLVIVYGYICFINFGHNKNSLTANFSIVLILTGAACLLPVTIHLRRLRKDYSKILRGTASNKHE